MADKRRDFWNGIAERYARSPISDEAAYRRKLEITQNLMTPGMHVLEFGCGTGSTAILHAPRVGHYRAMDISDRMIEIARAKPGAELVSFEVADFEAEDLAPDSLDMVLGMSILHLLENPDAAIFKAFRALKPGGYFISSTACVGGMTLLKLIAPIGQYFGKIPHLSWLTEESLRQMMRAAGFEIVEDWQPRKRAGLFLVAKKPA